MTAGIHMRMTTVKMRAKYQPSMRACRLRRSNRSLAAGSGGGAHGSCSAPSSGEVGGLLRSARGVSGPLRPKPCAKAPSSPSRRRSWCHQQLSAMYTAYRHGRKAMAGMYAIQKKKVEAVSYSWATQASPCDGKARNGRKPHMCHVETSAEKTRTRPHRRTTTR
eukprot:scaffold20629_cov32-Tisochrysis_lutea.AAC.2